MKNKKACVRNKTQRTMRAYFRVKKCANEIKSAKGVSCRQAKRTMRT